MPALRPPDVGPIIGHVSDTTGCVWIRGGGTEDSGAHLNSSQRTLGVIAEIEINPGGDASGHNGRDRLREQIQRDLRRNPAGITPRYFRLHREYDRTGTFRLGEQQCLTGRESEPLKPETDYLVLVGTLTLDDPFDDEDTIPDGAVGHRLPSPDVWVHDLLALPPERSTASFRTFAERSGSPGQLSFILGSCRYPGLLWKAKESDEIFGPLLDEALGDGRRPAGETTPAFAPKRPVQFALMVGDQIYADMLNRHIPLGLADTYEEFQERYHTAFGSPNMRRLLRQVPTYMILDDHEIEDNWTQDRVGKSASRRVFNLAIGAYLSYQWSHGPRSFGTRLYYHFECNGYPFFVIDTRTQRYVDDVLESLEDNHLLGRPTLGGEEPGQLDRLLRWLVEQQTRRGDAPKFIVSSSVFAPNPISAREGRAGPPELQVRWKEASDSWPAFPNTRRALLRCIISNAVQNVVFLSGDIHCANVAAIELSGSDKAAALKAFSITSSALYWPFAFADGDPSNYVHDSQQEEQRDTFAIDDRHVMNYRAWNFTQEDNFCRVDIDPTTHRLHVSVMDRSGEIVRKRDWSGRSTDIPVITELQLSPW